MRMIYKVAKNAKCQNGDETTKRNGEAVLKGVTKAAIRVLKSHGKVEFRTLDVDTWRDRNGSHYVLHSTCWWIAHNRIKLTNPLNSCLVLKGIKHYISCSYCYFLSHVFFFYYKETSYYILPSCYCFHGFNFWSRKYSQTDLTEILIGTDLLVPTA